MSFSSHVTLNSSMAWARSCDEGGPVSSGEQSGSGLGGFKHLGGKGEGEVD